MAKLIECRGCGAEISKKAKTCPTCGEPAKKKTSLLTWLVLILFLAFIFNVLDTSDSSSSSITTKSPKQLAVDLVSIESFSWKKGGFDNIMEASFKINNKSKSTIKDIEITCEHSAKSGTKIDSNNRTIYDTVKANSTKTFRDFNMGFIHNQAASSSCYISDFKI